MPSAYEAFMIDLECLGLTFKLNIISLKVSHCHFCDFNGNFYKMSNVNEWDGARSSKETWDETNHKLMSIS